MAYLIHEAYAVMDNNVDGFLRDILKTNRKEDLTVWVSGGCIYDEDSLEDTEVVIGNRNFVEKLINNLFDKGKVHFLWPKKNIFVEMVIHTETGKCDIIEVNTFGPNHGK